MKAITVDTTYLLPLFGVKVKEINPEILIQLHSHQTTLLYPKLLIPELTAKIAREAIKRKLAEPPSQFHEALEALLLEVDITLVEPKKSHLETAVKLRILGHKDIFDNILYATALHEKTLLLTEDTTLIKFLEKHGMPTHFIIDQAKAKTLIQQKEMKRNHQGTPRL